MRSAVAAWRALYREVRHAAPPLPRGKVDEMLMRSCIAACGGDAGEVLVRARRLLVLRDPWVAGTDRGLGVLRHCIDRPGVACPAAKGYGDPADRGARGTGQVI